MPNAFIAHYPLTSRRPPPHITHFPQSHPPSPPLNIDHTLLSLTCTSCCCCCCCSCLIPCLLHCRPLNSHPSLPPLPLPAPPGPSPAHLMFSYHGLEQFGYPGQDEDVLDVNQGHP